MAALPLYPNWKTAYTDLCSIADNFLPFYDQFDYMVDAENNLINLPTPQDALVLHLHNPCFLCSIPLEYQKLYSEITDAFSRWFVKTLDIDFLFYNNGHALPNNSYGLLLISSYLNEAIKNYHCKNDTELKNIFKFTVTGYSAWLPEELRYELENVHSEFFWIDYRENQHNFYVRDEHIKNVELLCNENKLDYFIKKNRVYFDTLNAAIFIMKAYAKWFGKTWTERTIRLPFGDGY